MALPEELIKDEKLVDYLLGLLPEDEAERLDEATIVDDDMAARLCVVENDLVDAYAAETLERGMRARFEAYYLMSPQRREKVRFAKRFLGAVDRAARPIRPLAVAHSSSERVRQFPIKPGNRGARGPRSRISWPALTAAASVALACGVMVNDLQLRQGLSRARRLSDAQDRRTQALAEQLDRARSENVEIAQALERARAASTPGGRTAASARPAVSSSPAAAARPAILFPQTRSIGQVPTVPVAAGADSVPFELRLESTDFTQYRAILKDPDTNRIAWRSAIVHARSASPAFVSIVVPASVLEPRHYSFELAGVDEAGHETTTGTYALRIDRR